LKLYFAKDKNFNGDLNKGLLIIGGYGTGKSLALKVYQIFNLAMRNNKYFPIFDTDEIIDTFTKQGRPSIDKYNPEYDIAIDDLGQDTGKHYYFGSIDDPVDVLLGRRYKMFKNYGILTHGTSNLDANQLKERFSGMVYDRMCEMFNTVPLVGTSWRIK
jgi:DNA replication protein DnaC